MLVERSNKEVPPLRWCTHFVRHPEALVIIKIDCATIARDIPAALVAELDAVANSLTLHDPSPA